MLTDIIWTARARDRHLQHRHRAPARGNLRPAREAASVATSGASAWCIPIRRPSSSWLPRRASTASTTASRRASPAATCARSSPSSAPSPATRRWVTGVRREQSATRAQGEAVEWDAQYGLHKVSPLLDWTEEQVWQYIRARKLPYNALHDKRYPEHRLRSPAHAPSSRARTAAPAAGGGRSPNRASAACSRACARPSARA